MLLDFNPRVFTASSALILAFVVVSLANLREFASTVDHLQAWIANQTGWFLVLTVNVILGYLLFLYHLFEPPHGAEPGSEAAYEDAIKTTFLHWGLHTADCSHLGRAAVRRADPRDDIQRAPCGAGGPTQNIGVGGALGAQ